ncbi:SGNH/GDSL hydrolase family protein [bacterium]|nr:SGNH/GDSL hydrolase family protein [Akkermansiaceae bacterium]MDB4422561.1 SGNH/GDSL hydrolase family protein [bacterium]MDA7891367.1 SGNH/GDSL hydrolase family protein [Akkermansiaceae bacterium]MDA7907376.1 SGNH/GDSL hydrolase family protein [Akkermansiaceae bacterium]MDA7934405.1 SGNH/GDSL hydrolase family protein [Akkermansiaceae bacterium]
MKAPFLLIPCLLFLGPVLRAQTIEIEKLDPNMTLEKADSKGIAWFDPRAAPFRLVGFPWIAEDKVYRRLPVEPKWPIRAAVDSLANSTAGGQIQFQSDSARILLRVKLRQASGMYHMPATGQSGFDLYVGGPLKQRYLSTSRFNTNAKDYEVTLFNGQKGKHYFTLNFPLYNGIESVEIGVVAGSTLAPPMPFASDGRVVVYGTSITQGGCAARPGMAYPNILSRRFNMEFINLGFSGNGKGEPALAKLINQIERKKLVVLDYEANAGGSIRETLGPFVEILRSQDKDVPILIISKIRYAGELFGLSQLEKARARAKFQAYFVSERQAAGDTKIYFLDGGSLLGEHAHECTVDGVHPTDLGFLKMADGIEPVIREILK